MKLKLHRSTGRYSQLQVGGQSYVWDKAIFRIGCIVLLVYTVFAGAFTSYIVIDCPQTQRLYCDNPFYLEYDLSNKLPVNIIEMKTFYPGFTYDPRPWGVKNYGAVLTWLIALMFLVNHLAHNKTFLFKTLWSDVKNG